MANAKMNPKKTDRQIMEEAGTTFPEYMENLLSQLGEMGYTKVEISKYFHENYALSEWFPLGYTEVNDETLNGCDHQGQVRLFDPCITCGSVHHIWCPSCERHLCHDNYGNRINIQTNTQTVNMSFSNEINTPIQPNEVLKTVDVKDDPVNHPSHYTQFPVEIIEISFRNESNNWYNQDCEKDSVIHGSAV